jgi:hypothetical protein
LTRHSDAKSTADSENVEADSKQESEKSQHRFWNHITISRDQTFSSNFRKDLLISLLRSSRVDHSNAHEPLEEYTVKIYKPVREDLPTRLKKEVWNWIPPSSAFNDLRQTQNLGMEFSSQSNRQPAPDSKMQVSTNPVRHQEDVSFEELKHRIMSLESENQALKVNHEVTMKWETLYFIQNRSGFGGPQGQQHATTYLDEPTWASGPKGDVVLRAHFPIVDIDGYLRTKHDIAFVVAKWYSPKFQEDEAEQAARDKKRLPLPKCFTETIRLYSKDMIAAAEDFFGRQTGFLERYPDFNIKDNHPAPYLFWYYHRKPGTDLFGNMSPLHQELMNLLTGWIDKNYGELYCQAEEQLKRGKVSYNTMEFLFKPGEVVVSKAKRSVSSAIAKAWLHPTTPKELIWGAASARRVSGWRNPHAGPGIMKKPLWTWSLKCWSYKYDGLFWKSDQNVNIVLDCEDTDTEINIRDLDSFPLQYADEWKDTLTRRGQTFWSCRYRRLVSYQDDSGLYGVRLRTPPLIASVTNESSERRPIHDRLRHL